MDEGITGDRRMDGGADEETKETKMINWRARNKRRGRPAKWLGGGALELGIDSAAFGDDNGARAGTGFGAAEAGFGRRWVGGASRLGVPAGWFNWRLLEMKEMGEKGWVVNQ
jgi:hypothetical protein